jgi:valyl-tRNA synthetase
MDRYDARERIVHDLAEAGLLARTADHPNRIGRCYRCDTVIEPYLSDQWFVRMKPLASPALDAVRDGTVRFFPDRWTKVYEHWMTNIRDWCISRQLWWGHRIPVWYCTGSADRTDRCNEPIVSRTAPSACPHCNGTSLRQDEDVLDTWFSSWLWPFSVHDWPAQDTTGKGGDLRYFYPTDTLVTAPEIIFFWVARMIMAGLKFGPTFTGSTDATKNVPFRDVYFTSIVRDARGRKMSKSLGNSPEPMELIAEYGADAVRFTMLALAPVGQDIIYAKEKNELGRNLANKIWNAGRFLMMNRDQTGEAPRPVEFNTDHADLADRWILSRLHSTLRDVKESVSLFEFNRITRQMYDFFWHDYCDWYVEMVKSRLYGPESLPVKQAVVTRGLDVYDAALRLLHPIMPFVTEELWQSIRPRPAGATIMRERIPEPDLASIDTAVERQMAYVQSVIEAVRTIRGEMSIPPSREIALLMTAGDAHPAAEVLRYEGYMMRLARVTSLSIIEPGLRPPLSATAVVEGEEIFVPLEGVIDLDIERNRLRREIDRVSEMLKGIGAKLGNPAFTEKAPGEVVRKEREKQAAFEANLAKLSRSLGQLSTEGENSGKGPAR